jgi:transcriptional regulator with XRE-family HTH domain
LFVATIFEQYIAQMQELSLSKVNSAKSVCYDDGMKKNKSEVGGRIMELRQGLGLTQRQLAEKLGVPQSNVAYWEAKAPAPPGEVLPSLAKVLLVSVDELLGVAPVRPKCLPAKGRLQQVFEQASKLPRRQQQKVAEFVEAFVEKKAVASS